MNILGPPNFNSQLYTVTCADEPGFLAAQTPSRRIVRAPPASRACTTPCPFPGNVIGVGGSLSQDKSTHLSPGSGCKIRAFVTVPLGTGSDSLYMESEQPSSDSRLRSERRQERPSTLQKKSEQRFKPHTLKPTPSSWADFLSLITVPSLPGSHPRPSPVAFVGVRHALGNAPVIT